MIRAFIQGNTVTVRKQYTAYPPSLGFECDLVISGPVHAVYHSIVDEDTFVFNLSTSDTSVLPEGEYWWQINISNTSMNELSTVESGTLTVQRGLALHTDPYDGRSQVKQIIDAIEATLLGRATTDQLSYTIAGVTIEKISIPDLLKLRDTYVRAYTEELQAERLSKGEGSGNKIRVRFV